MEKKNTKEQILEEALTLFSQQGYDGISVRDIARAVGIRESSLYKHYRGKQDIFDSLLANMVENHRQAIKNFQIPHEDFTQAAAAYQKLGIDGLKMLCRRVYQYYTKDPHGSRFRRILLMEQFRNNDAKDAYHNFFICDALDYQNRLFAELIKIGLYKEADPQIMALEFYAPIYLLIDRYDGSATGEREGLKLLDRHIDQFTALYQAERN